MSMKESKARLVTADDMTEKIKIENGVKQGDALSTTQCGFGGVSEGKRM